MSSIPGDTVELLQQGSVLSRQGEERLRRLLETTGAVPWEADAKTTQFTYVGPQVERLLGYKRDRWYEQDFWPAHIHPADRDNTVKVCEQKSRTCEDYELSYRMIAADGQIVWIHDIVNVLSADGKPHTLLGFLIDITEHTRRAEELSAALEEIARLKADLEAQNIYLREEIKVQHNFEEIIGQSRALKEALAKVESVAATDTTVLITGETGTGKELLARAIHNLSSRKNRPLVKVDCSSLPPSLIESELFGREKGAYTGAHTRQVGRFELANGGSIFLDEIGDLPLEVQAKLLRALQEGQFERLGSPRTIEVDVRVIAATNRELAEGVREGAFRPDLYYRLNVYPIHVPPLRAREEDIPMLTSAFVQRFAQNLGKEIDVVPQEVMDALTRYSWPGNVRELENVIERAVIISSNSTLQLADRFDSAPAPATESSWRRTMEEVEREHVHRVLKRTNWKIEGEGGAAQILGLNPGTLRSRLRKLGIQRPTG